MDLETIIFVADYITWSKRALTEAAGSAYCDLSVSRL